MLILGSPSLRIASSVLALGLLGCGCSCEKKPKTQPKTVATAMATVTASSPTAATGTPEANRTCPDFHKGKKQGRIANSDLREASGLAASRMNPSVLWSHNDSGNNPRLFAMTPDGRDLGAYQLAKSDLEDWEDLAIGPAEKPGEWYLYVGDIGTNTKERHRVSVYRVLEPKVTLEQEPVKRKLRNVERFDFTYPDEQVHDAETLMVDPRTSDLYIVTKPRSDTPRLYRAKAPLSPRETRVLEQIALLSVFDRGTKRSTLVTAGDISPDGSQILLRTYSTAYLWQRQDGESIDNAMRLDPCPVPLSHEPQGETIAFSPFGNGYFTVSEGTETKILFFERRH